MSSDPTFWRARGADWVFTWGPGGVDGDPALCEAVETYFALNDAVPLTVTGPDLPADLTDPAAVLAFVRAERPDATFDGDLPDLDALLEGPEGAHF